jgi:DNA-binding response OmpR family regulator
LTDAIHRPIHVLVADDDVDLSVLVGFTLTQAGFIAHPVHNGRAALDAFEVDPPDFLVLDINMPDVNGLEVCRQIRARSTVPIMMLTARNQEEDLLTAFENGADDYVCKPFSPRALVARVKALLRRAEPQDIGTISAGRFVLDLEQHTLRIGQRDPIVLTPLEMKAMQVLIPAAGRTVPSDKLLMHIWSRSTASDRHTLKQLIYRLRHKLEREAAEPNALQTTPGSGYKLIVD